MLIRDVGMVSKILHRLPRTSNQIPRENPEFVVHYKHEHAQLQFFHPLIKLAVIMLKDTVPIIHKSLFIIWTSFKIMITHLN